MEGERRTEVCRGLNFTGSAPHKVACSLCHHSPGAAWAERKKLLNHTIPVSPYHAIIGPVRPMNRSKAKGPCEPWVVPCSSVLHNPLPDHWVL